MATSSKRAGNIDSPSAVASEGIPPYRVTFDVSDQEEGEVGDTTSLLGDGQFDPHEIFVIYSAPSLETQTTRFESQMTGPSFMFNTQDGVDVPYHPDSTWPTFRTLWHIVTLDLVYLHDNDDDADAYAADFERGRISPIPRSNGNPNQVHRIRHHPSS